MTTTTATTRTEYFGLPLFVSFQWTCRTCASVFHGWWELRSHEITQHRVNPCIEAPEVVSYPSPPTRVRLDQRVARSMRLTTPKHFAANSTSEPEYGHLSVPEPEPERESMSVPEFVPEPTPKPVHVSLSSPTPPPPPVPVPMSVPVPMPPSSQAPVSYYMPAGHTSDTTLVTSSSVSHTVTLPVTSHRSGENATCAWRERWVQHRVLKCSPHHAPTWTTQWTVELEPYVPSNHRYSHKHKHKHKHPSAYRRAPGSSTMYRTPPAGVSGARSTQVDEGLSWTSVVQTP